MDGMERITLREAAQRTSRSVTTLRRYIRSGRLRASKRMGRFGPEYFVSEHDLVGAGLETAGETSAPAQALARASAPSQDPGEPRDGRLPQRREADAVPMILYQDLQLKHEQLLVQYGMVRAGGLRVMELQSQMESLRKQHDKDRAENARLRQRLRTEGESLQRALREAQLELEGRAIEIAALKEKVKALELLTRNAVTTEAIEKQFQDVMEQSRKVDRLAAPQSAGRPSWNSPPPENEPLDH